MNSLFFLLLIVSICCNRLYCHTAVTSENLKMVRRSLGMPTMSSVESHIQGKQVSQRDVLLPQQSPLKMEELKRIANTRVDSSNRKTKILGNLAFLAGLNIGGSAGAASSTAKTYIKPPVALKLDASQLSPHVATIYDPHSYLPHSYILATSLGFYPVLNPLRLQSIGGIQNEFQTFTQNPQASTLNLLENKKLNPLNNNDEYTGEAKNADGEVDESTELHVEDVRKAEEKVSSSETVCNLQQGYNREQGNLLKSAPKEKEDGSLATSALRAANTPIQNTGRNDTNTNTTSLKNETWSTMNDNATGTSHFYGYYGGYPQNINHIDFTTETNEFKYHDYDHINYNLPYEKPANFYSDEKYNYYSNSNADSFPPNQFQQEQVPEYFSNDFDKFLYTPENTPQFLNSDFRPVV
ncbi:uncharacterized protein LOC143378512 [Andrena cerasifolii]|uniref:uncharacterized protein LOC143378512 n=1 Tax=Andrena cerasifolii TaxID=2819439 RepID=UPI0040380A51